MNRLIPVLAAAFGLGMASYAMRDYTIRETLPMDAPIVQEARPKSNLVYRTCVNPEIVRTLGGADTCGTNDAWLFWRDRDGRAVMQTDFGREYFGRFVVSAEPVKGYTRVSPQSVLGGLIQQDLSGLEKALTRSDTTVSSSEKIGPYKITKLNYGADLNKVKPGPNEIVLVFQGSDWP